MRRLLRGTARLGVDVSRRSPDRLGSGVLLLVIVTGVLGHHLSRADITVPTLAPASERVDAVTVPRPTVPVPEEELPAPSPPVHPVAASPTVIRQGGEPPHAQAPVAPMLTSAELALLKPNELGHIPVLMYHAFTTNPEDLDEWTTTPDAFRDDLQWLYKHAFFIISLADLIDNKIAVPPGKHPVVLTFDDSSSGQFRLRKDATGQLAPDPVTAVGVMEAFFAKHPDFGRGGFFAVVPVKCFAHDDEVTTCEERLAWLAEHGYEIGNHTWWHENLGDVNDETFRSQIGDTKLWIDERVPGDANSSTILVLPFGEYPGYGREFDMLVNGFPWEGQTIQLTGVVAVNGGPSVSPSSVAWDPWAIARLNTDDATFGYWQAQIEADAITLYTSDGNPALITIPDDLPGDIVDQLDAELISRRGRSLVRYDAAPADD